MAKKTKKTKKTTKSSVVNNILKELERIDKQKESNKISQRQHDTSSKKAVIKGINKLKCSN